ncbi:hypothetical protein ACNF40_08255 [Cuniculiplasma sp. SKW4]|uniref:hypothetical protein n=1 Tax=Cuniculiplasma sp. SKW4 TaxID=3400171 RepID=UPI003FD5E08A
MFEKNRKIMVVMVVSLFLFSGLFFINSEGQKDKVSNNLTNNAANSQMVLENSGMSGLEVHKLSYKQPELSISQNNKTPQSSHFVTVYFKFKNYNSSLGEIYVTLTDKSVGLTQGTNNPYLNISTNSGIYNYSISFFNYTSYSSESIRLNELNGTINTSVTLNYTVTLPRFYVESLNLKTNIIPAEILTESLAFYSPTDKISTQVNFYNMFTLSPKFILLNGTYNSQIMLNMGVVNTTLTFSGSYVSQETVTLPYFHSFVLEFSNFPYSANYSLELIKGLFTIITAGSITLTNAQLSPIYLPNGTFMIEVQFNGFLGSEILQAKKVLNLTGVSIYDYVIPTMKEYAIPVNGEKDLTLCSANQNLSISILDDYNSLSSSGTMNVYGFTSTSIFNLMYESYKSNYSEETFVSNFQSLSLNFSQVNFSTPAIYKNGTFGMGIISQSDFNLSSSAINNYIHLFSSNNYLNVTLPDHQVKVLLSDFNMSSRYTEEVNINPSKINSFSFSSVNVLCGEIVVRNLPSNEEAIYLNSTSHSNNSCFSGYGSITGTNSSIAIFKVPEIQGENNIEVSIILNNSQIFGVSENLNIKNNGNITNINVPKLDGFYLNVENFDRIGFFNVLILSNFKIPISLSSSLSTVLPNYTAFIGEMHLEGNGTTYAYMPSGTYYSYMALSIIFTETVLRLPNVTVSSGAKINIEIPDFSVLVFEKPGLNLLTSRISISGQNFSSEISPGIFSGNGFLPGIFSLSSISFLPFIVPIHTEVTISSSTCISGVYVNPSEQSLYTENSINYFSVTASFSPVKEYRVNFIAQDLGKGVYWKVTIINKTSSNSVNASSNTSCIYFNLPNGSYNYTVQVNSSEYKATDSMGNFTVSGKELNITISFEMYQKVQTKYTAIFQEKGLSKGTAWSVTIGTIIYFSTANHIYVNLTNGTYSYSVGNIKGYNLSNGSGSFQINGKNTSINVTFTPVPVLPAKYTVTFKEEGLSNGTMWYIIFDNKNVSTKNATLSFMVTNGTYSYKTGNVSGYNVTPLNGNVDVKGNNVTVSITYTLIQTKTSPSSNTLSSNLYIIIAIIAAVIIVAVVAVIWKRKSP